MLKPTQINIAVQRNPVSRNPSTAVNTYKWRYRNSLIKKDSAFKICTFLCIVEVGAQDYVLSPKKKFPIPVKRFALVVEVVLHGERNY